MISIIIWFASCFFVCPNPAHTIEDHGDCPLEHVTHSAPPTGGETGGGPKPPGILSPSAPGN